MIHTGQRKVGKNDPAVCQSPGTYTSTDSSLTSEAMVSVLLFWGRAGVLPELRTPFPVLLFPVGLASPPDVNLKTTRRCQITPPNPYTFFHKWFLPLQVDVISQP